ncbi:HIT family protein [Candidatus Micrarchaeota archaeon]|nr:HIT family protein [Candidatus Micrarchaeota archaeon]
MKDECKTKGECIFCKIIKKEIPANIVFENEHALSFLDINPANKGHALIIPKKHAETTLDLNEKELKELVVVVLKVAKAVKKTTGSQAFNIIQNDGKLAGQLVMHAHFHIVPRFENDGLDYRTKRTQYAHGEASELAKQINKAIE